MRRDDTPDQTEPSPGGVVRGASERDLARPAAEFLAEVAWDERAPDPDALDAESFLALL
jgi:hypothetical protein